MTGRHTQSYKLSDCIWQNAAPNGTPFLEPVESANTKRPQKRVRNPDPILAPVFTQCSLLSSVLILQFATKRWKTSLGKFPTSCADFELAGAADQRAGNNKKQQQSCGIVRFCFSNKVFHCEGSAFGWLSPLELIHISNFSKLASCSQTSNHCSKKSEDARLPIRQKSIKTEARIL